jgi:hypothetical protein
MPLDNRAAAALRAGRQDRPSEVRAGPYSFIFKAGPGGTLAGLLADAGIFRQNAHAAIAALQGILGTVYSFSCKKLYTVPRFLRLGPLLAEAVEKLFWSLKFRNFREYVKIKSNKIKGVIICLSAILAKVCSKRLI